jgi:hypothetical protein
MIGFACGPNRVAVFAAAEAVKEALFLDYVE